MSTENNNYLENDYSANAMRDKAFELKMSNLSDDMKNILDKIKNANDNGEGLIKLLDSENTYEKLPVLHRSDISLLKKLGYETIEKSVNDDSTEFKLLVVRWDAF